MSARDRGSGGSDSKAAGVGIGLVVVVMFTLLPFMVAIAFYVFAQVQAIITGLDLSSETLNIPVFLIVLVGTVTLFVVGIHALVSLIGRSFTPKRREDRDVELAFEEPVEP
jgi:TRAP-type mannitol/chloroaromatic compound transport system permease small subunit